MPGMGIGVGDDDGASRMGDCLKRRALGGVRHVDRKADPVHLVHRLATHAGQARILALIAAGREQRLIVVGELHESQAQRVENLGEPDVILDAGRVLSPEKDCSPPLACGAVHVGAGTSLEDQFGKSLEVPIPACDIGRGLAEALMIADGRMNGGDAPLAHVAEDRFRPVAILEAIDDERRHRFRVALEELGIVIRLRAVARAAVGDGQL